MQNYFTEKVKAIRALDGYRLHVIFADGFQSAIDLAALLEEGPIYQPLRDLKNFRSVAVSRHGVPEWPQDLDLSPGSLRAWCEAGKLLSLEETDRWVAEHETAPGKAA